MHTSESEIRTKLEKHNEYLGQDPNNLRLITEVATLHMQLGEIDSARSMLTNALVDNSQDAGLKFQLASVEMAAGQFEKAIEILEALQAEGIDNPVLVYNLAYAYMFVYRHSDAKALLLGIIDDATYAPDAALLLSRACHHLGDMDEAIKYATIHQQMNPDNPASTGVLAMLSLDMEDFDNAQRFAEDALTKDERNLEALVSLGHVQLHVQNSKDAIQYFDKAVANHPQSGRAWAGHGLGQMMGLNLPAAIEDLEKAVRFMPNHIGTWHALAWSYLASNMLDKAEEAFNSANDIDRNFGETYGGLAVIEIHRGNFQAGKELAEKSLRLDPGSFSGRFAKILLINRASPETAQKLVTKILNSSIDESGDKLITVLGRNPEFVKKVNTTETKSDLH